jgi:hypothetical protein
MDDLEKDDVKFDRTFIVRDLVRPRAVVVVLDIPRLGWIGPIRRCEIGETF